MSDDLRERAAAYWDEEGAPDAGEISAPAIWTPEWVQIRLVAAFDALFRSGGRVGPREFGNAWPSILQDVADLLDGNPEYQRALTSGRKWKAANMAVRAHQQIQEQRGRELREDADRQRALPSDVEIALMDEALRWAAVYLLDSPLYADALQFWALCKARGLPMKKILHARAVRADAMIEYRGALEKKRCVEAWTRRGVRLEPPPRATRQEVMPDKVFTHRWLELNRKRAAALLAERLNRARVAVR